MTIPWIHLQLRFSPSFNSTRMAMALGVPWAFSGGTPLSHERESWLPLKMEFPSMDFFEAIFWGTSMTMETSIYGVCFFWEIPDIKMQDLAETMFHCHPWQIGGFLDRTFMTWDKFFVMTFSVKWKSTGQKSGRLNGGDMKVPQKLREIWEGKMRYTCWNPVVEVETKSSPNSGYEDT